MVIYDSNNADTGSIAAIPAFQTVTTPSTTAGTLPTVPTRPGYTFDGWNTQANGGGTTFTANTTVNANLTVYAQWIPTAEPPPVEPPPVEPPPVEPPPAELTYEITLAPTAKSFPAMQTGYDNADMAQTFNIENTGTEQITGLNAFISFGGFEIISDVSPTAINPGETAMVTVRPLNDLENGSHVGALSIRGDNGIDGVAVLEFMVSDEPVHAASVDPASITFTAAQSGYSNAAMVRTVTVENTGTEDITGLTATLLNQNFVFNPIDSAIAAGGSVTVRLRPANGLAANAVPYTDTLRITGDNGINLSVSLSFTVSEMPTFTVMAEPSSKTFDTVLEGYSNTALAQEFTIRNTGTGRLTGLSASLGSSDFVISSNLSTDSVNTGNAVRVSVTPANGLAARATPYTDTLTITGDNGIFFTIPLSFTVNAVPINVLYGDLNGDGVVNSADLILMLRYFAQSGITIDLAAADVNGDGVVDSADLILFLRYFAQPGVILGRQN
jgi:uncharacterized repeat protein (TIGR02543 family)